MEKSHPNQDRGAHFAQAPMQFQTSPGRSLSPPPFSLSAQPLQRKELPNETPDADLGPGDWREKDREANNDTWKKANAHNLQQPNGHEQYQTITERTAFYQWFHQVIQEKGHEVKWVGSASIVSEQMAGLDGILAKMFVSQEIIDFGNAGNKAIFDDVFPHLRALYNRDQPLKGDAAKAWDQETLRREQFDVIEPLYAQQSEETLDTLQSMAEGEGFYGFGTAPELKMKGDVRNPQDRYDHGMAMVAPFKEKYGSLENYRSISKWHKRSSGKAGDGEISGVLDPDNPGLPKPWEPKY